MNKKKSAINHPSLYWSLENNNNMASSRWKRFAFFEKNALSLPSEVLEDLLPTGESSSSNFRTGRRSSSVETLHDKVNMVVTTAALPLDSKPKPVIVGNNFPSNNNNNTSEALTSMWSSFTACHPMEHMPSKITLPSQAQVFEDDSNLVSSETAVDGLVLAFVTSCDTDRVHCFDVSVRCSNSNKASTDSSLSDATANDKPAPIRSDLEDMDGWRGYLAPVPQWNQRYGPDPRTNAEDRIVAEHMGGSSKTEECREGIVGIATCRATSGHRPIHMACITATNLVVCVDPHLYLSW